MLLPCWNDYFIHVKFLEEQHTIISCGNNSRLVFDSVPDRHPVPDPDPSLFSEKC
jgi:hypothetical protein